VIRVFIWSPEDEGEWPNGGALRWWLHQSLLQLDNSLRQRGSRLIYRTGQVVAELTKLAEETDASAVF